MRDGKHSHRGRRGNIFQFNRETVSKPRRKLFPLWLGKCFLFVAFVAFAQEQEVSRFLLVQYRNDGASRWELSGRSAVVEGRQVKIDEVSALAFEKDAVIKLKARQGTFDRDGGLVHLEDDVVFKTTDGTRINTDSLNWNVEERNIFTDTSVNVKLRLSAEAENESISAKAETTITCDGPFQIDYRKNKATFQNNVEVEYSQGQMCSDRMDVYFDKDAGRVRCIIARGDVRIVKGESVTYSQKAIYLVSQDRLVLPKESKLIIDMDSRSPLGVRLGEPSARREAEGFRGNDKDRTDE